MWILNKLQIKNPRTNVRGFLWWSIVHGSRTFKSFAAQRYRVPVLSVKSSFPNLSHHEHKYSQGSRQCRESARKKHLASGRKQPMRHTPSQRLYILLLRDTAPYPVFPGRTRPLSILENFLPHGTAFLLGRAVPQTLLLRLRQTRSYRTALVISSNVSWRSHFPNT